MELDELFFYNPHWKTGVLRKSPYKIKRKLFSRLKKTFDDRYIVTIQGLRRTGKSILQDQYVEAYLENLPEISPSRILKYTFEKEDDLDLLPSSELEDLLKLFFSRILQTQAAELKEKIIIALDEVQNVENWQSMIKKYYDVSPLIKFILTGSSSLYLREGSESLAGRALDFELGCLDFQEYLELIGSHSNVPFVKSLEELLQVTPFDVDEEVVKVFETFLLIGGFPEVALMHAEGRKDIGELHRFIRESIINKVIKRDLKKYFHVKNTIVDQRLFHVCCKESSCFVELSKLAPETGLSLVSVKNHLDIFEQSHLLHFLSKFDRKLRREIKSTRKIYVASPCLMFAFVSGESLEDREYLGHVAETYAFHLLKKMESEIFVEKGKEARQEVDFYLPANNLLCECKYSQTFDSRKFSYLVSRSSELQARSLVLSKRSWGDDRVIAAPLFLLAP